MSLPGEKFLETLETLRIELNKSGIQRTHGLLKAGGNTCLYYNKSLALFLKDDYLRLKELLNQATILIDECEKIE